MTNRIVLFDMDGTITPPRSPIEKSVEDNLFKLSKFCTVGIVTGSDYEYVRQQCGSLLNSDRDLSNFVILPCNGTKKYVYDSKKKEWIKESSLDMREHLGQEKFRKLMFFLMENMYLTHLTNPQMIPTMGNFISYRGSLINWCPIGRSSSEKERSEFIEYDASERIRKRRINIFKNSDWSSTVSFSMGGSTSIDVYPAGWDKTYALNHFEDFEHWFVGDRCTMEEGNDKPLYDKIKSIHSKRAFEVKNTKDTIKIINNLIRKWDAK